MNPENTMNKANMIHGYHFVGIVNTRKPRGTSGNHKQSRTIRVSNGPNVPNDVRVTAAGSMVTATVAAMTTKITFAMIGR